MAGEQHLKIAAASIRKAVAEKQHEINELRHQMDRQRADLQHHIDDLAKSITQKEAIISRGDLNSSERVALLRGVQDHNSAIETARREINQVHDNLRRAINDIERDAQDLMTKAVEFEQQWGS